jgi:putative transposase
VTELKNRGVEDILIACVDGLKGFPEALETVFPKTVVQTCIVHLIRASMKYVPWKERRQVAAALREVYQADTEGAAEDALDEFELEWGSRYPMTVACWRNAWTRVIPFLSYPKDIRKALYTTNAIESMNYQVRKVTSSRGHFPNDEAVFKLAYLALRNAAAKWTRPIQNWPQALQQFALHFDGRIPARLD